MDLKKYEVLLKVINRGSINNVSFDLGYTHSGISKMLNGMEQELGFKIIKRTNKGITLTPEGETILPMIRMLVRKNEMLEEYISQINGLEIGKVRIGCFPTTAFVLMPDLLRVFEEKYPKIQVEVLEEQSIDRLEQWMNRGIIDVGIMSRQPGHNFHWFREIEDSYVAMLPKGHPLASLEVVPLTSLLQAKVLLFRSHKGLDQDIINLSKYVDISTINLSYTTNSDFTAIRMVESNGFVTIIPELIASYAVKHFQVEKRPMDIELKRNIGFAVKSKDDISPSVRRFIRCVKEQSI